MFGKVIALGAVLIALALGIDAQLWAATINVTVKDGAGIAIPTGFRWLLEEDATYPNIPGAPSPYGPRDPASLTYGFDKSYMPVAAKGEIAVGGGGVAQILNVDPLKRYYLSILPHRPAGNDCSSPGCYSISGAQVAFATGAGTADVTVVVPSQGIPTAQISVLAFHDNNAINHFPDLPQEAGLPGFSVLIADQGGQLLTDVFGNPLGTTYQADGITPNMPLGTGIVLTMTQADVNIPAKNPYGLKVGEALVKNLAPGKYAVQILPPTGEGWQQTTTIEGTKVVDAWVRANEPRYMVEFGPSFHHVFIGFVKQFDAINTIPSVGPTGTIIGSVVNGHLDRLAVRVGGIGLNDGHLIPNCWVGLNTTGLATAITGVYAAPCAADSSFSIPSVPPGTYQLVLWDEHKDSIIGFRVVIVPAAGGVVDMGKVQLLRWFARQDHYVFNDINQDGKRDPGEDGIPEQVVNLRFRDGTIYQSFPTDLEGYVPFDEVFPFFHWQIAEVDYLRFKPTGVTVYVDAGGPVNTATQEAPGWGKLNPQIQPGGATSRTDGVGTLLEAYQGFQGTTNVFEWGKAPYVFGENGGISGVVHYAVTRAENDPKLAVGDPWEPGIPRVQINMYERAVTAGAINDVNGVPGIQLADVDNYPFGWKAGGAMGPEDVKRNNLGATPTTFSAGDAVSIVTTDSWDESTPTGCVNPIDDLFYGPPLAQDQCHDGLRNYNQVRPGVFDGGYAFVSKSSGGALVEPIPPGFYIIEAVAPKGYDHQTEESKNVDFGDAAVISPLVLPPACVNNDLPGHVVPAELTLFPGIAAPNALATTPLCDRKEIFLAGGSNPGVNFFLYTDVPGSTHVTGQITSDLTNEQDKTSANFGEKLGPAFIPLSFRDWTGHEVTRVYTNEYGRYNALVPSSYNINVPHPSGVGPGVYSVCLNHPGPIVDPNNPGGPMIIDPFFNKQWNQLCLSFQFEPNRTIILDTPILPASAFVGSGQWQLACNCPDKSPGIYSVNEVSGGPLTAVGQQLTIRSMGTQQVRDPNGLNNGGLVAGAQLVSRDNGFGAGGTVTIGGLALTGVAWSNDVITGTVPNGATTGQLVVTRADSGLSTVNSVTVHVGNGVFGVKRVPADFPTIQLAIEAAAPGDLILVAPGTYREPVIITKPIQLQGYGAGSTVINAIKLPPTNTLQGWHELANRLVNCPSVGLGQIDLLPGQDNNQLLAGAGVSPSTCGRVVNTGLFRNEEGAAIFVAPKAAGPNSFSNSVPSRIDGFTVTGTNQGGGIIVNAYARHLEISNNHVTNNIGFAGGGIRLGQQALVDPLFPTLHVSAQNTNVKIHHNHVSENASLFILGVPGAGVVVYNGSDNYSVTDNFVCGNFSHDDGGGVAHFGRSLDGVIARNKIVFNEAFNGTPGIGGSGGGIFIAGLPQPAGATLQQTRGSGSVKIDRNLIQGNSAGTGDGGGIMLRQINGQDVLVSPANSSTWYQIELTNNIIVNNVAGQAGGGIALVDAARTTIVNNTVAHNDSTATAGGAFPVGGQPNVTAPQPAGVVSSLHSAALMAALNVGGPTTFPRFSDPLMRNNIILNNRSFHYDLQALLFNYTSDLAVLPAGSVCGAVPCALNPRFSVLSTNAVGYHISNLLVDETATPVFRNAYYNVPPVAPYLGTIGLDGSFNQPLIAVAPSPGVALDEGGNYIQFFFGPLSVVGNYHLAVGAPAIDQGTNTILASNPSLARDYDNDVRPQGSAADIGADETPGAAAAIVKFILRRSDTDAIIVDPLLNGAIVDRLVLCGINCQVNIEAVTSASPIESVRLALSGPTTRARTDNNSPYTDPNNVGADFLGFTIAPGLYSLTATPYSADNLGGTAGTALTVGFTVVGNPAITTTPGTAATLGDLYTYDVNVTTAAIGTPTYSLTQLPPANRGLMTIDADGVIKWTPAIPNPNNANPTVSYSNQVRVRVTDAQGRFTEQTFTINVSPKAETLVVTSAAYNRNGVAADSWNISGTGTVNAGTCTGTPEVCGQLTIYRVRAGTQAIIGTITVAGGVWTFSETPASPGVAAGDAIRVRSLTGGLANSGLTIIP
jgi:parallel beta-helix repeat protein